MDSMEKKRRQNQESAKEIIMETIEVEAITAVVLATTEREKTRFCNLAPVVCNEDDYMCVCMCSN